MPSSSPIASNVPLPHELGLVGQSPAHRRLWDAIRKHAPLSVDVTLLGATGTGKTTVAKIIHKLSDRRKAPFRAVNCAAIPPALIEGELFGTERGSFTDARSRMGHFELAAGGTLFLDEIGEFSHELQAKLLTVIEAKAIRRLGGEREIPCDVRLIYATKRPLSDLREDFMYRLDGAVIRVPTLAERVEDIPEHVIYQFSVMQEKFGRAHPFIIHEEAMRAFAAYSWPGNIRELCNVVLKIAIDRSELEGDEDGLIDAETVHSTIALVNQADHNGRATAPAPAPDQDENHFLLAAKGDVNIPAFILDFRQGETFDKYAARVLIEAYEYLTGFGFSHKRAAAYLGIERASLYGRLEKARRTLKDTVVAPTRKRA